jgi:hypothetical protein
MRSIAVIIESIIVPRIWALHPPRRPLSVDPRDEPHSPDLLGSARRVIDLFSRVRPVIAPRASASFPPWHIESSLPTLRSAWDAPGRSLGVDGDVEAA